ncbi:nuclear receptor subfamily 2 group E member 1-like [Chrysoperla carnea]|uniref:nuclear receptor subfamily 2 group E member 1-like n=1 Tax=Chrysoperla carnea TaxID=189513 RepID=UPI001D08DDFC|nr:nuclear receptor subfamily 2 group E member 1-like [Chrysoperla carnea]
MNDRTTLPNSKPEVLCRVCGDKASGKHYGVASCDGCRGFFKRSIRRNLEYVCKENGRCVVDVTRRNQCQACRFRKCLQVNMKKDAVQHERAPRSCIPHGHHHGPHTNPLTGHLLPLPFPGMSFPRQFHNSFFTTGGAGLPLPTIQNRHPFLTNQIPTIPPNGFEATIPPSAPPGAPSTNSYGSNLFYPTMFSPTSIPSYFRGKFLNTMGIGNEIIDPVILPRSVNNLNNSTAHRQASNDDEVSSSEEANTQSVTQSPAVENSRMVEITNNNKIEQKMVTADNFNPFSTTISSTIFPSENIYESAAKLLFLSVKWARTIPSFLQLSHKDQNILLEESWGELFILTAAQWTLPIDESVLINNLTTNITKTLNLEEDAKRLRDIVTRLTLLQIDHTEYACLKALILFKSDCQHLADSGHVELLQDQTYVMLQEYCNSTSNRLHRLNSGDKRGAVRFGKLLLALPAVQSLSKRSLEELLFKKTIGDVAIERLLIDMIKSSS